MAANIKVVCGICGKTFLVHPYRLREKVAYCSFKCSGVGRRKRINASCQHCGKRFLTYPRKPKRFCSLACRDMAWRGQTHPRYKGARFRTVHGYIEINHPITGERVREHRYLMEKHLGRALEPHEVVHHKNGKKDDNRLANLEVLSHSLHSSMHNVITGWSRRYDCCIECGTTEAKHSGKGRCYRCAARARYAKRTATR